jgi:hypothetical protein
MLKKTAIAALVLGFSGAASAAMYAPAPAPACAAGNVTIPCEKNAWDLGIDALYLRPENVRLLDALGQRADYGWGFRLEGSYYFSTGNDVTLNWSHFKRTKDQTLTAAQAATATIVLGDTVNAGAASAEAKFDMVNFEFGQMINFGESVSTRFHGGLQYIQNTDNLTVQTLGTLDQKTTGFGPRAGVMSKYDFGNGFGVYGDVAAGMLVAKRTATSASDIHGTMITTDANVGVSYTHAMAQGDLTARLAWGVKQFTFNSGTEGFDGFTLGLKWVGNA